MAGPAYKSGDHYVICDECGFKVRSSQTKMRWDNMRVCLKDWEPRHPQEFVRGRRDQQRVPNARPETADVFLAVNEITADNLMGVPVTGASPGTASILFTGYAPSLLVDAGAQPGAADVVYNGFAPSIPVNVTVTPGVADVVYTGFSPTLPGDIAVTPGAADVVYNGFAPSITDDVAVAPGAADVVYNGFVPAPLVDAVAAPGTADVVYSGFAPTADGGAAVFDPADMFGASEAGGYWNVADLSSLFQERTGASATTPSAVGDVVGTQLDLSGNGNHRIAPSDAARPILRLSGGLYYLEHDNVDDEMFTSGISYASDTSEVIAFDPDGDSTYIVCGGQNNSWHDLALNGNPAAGAGNGIGGVHTRRLDGVAAAAGIRDEVHDEFDAGTAHVLTLENVDMSGWTKHGHFYYENTAFRFGGKYYGGVTLGRDFTGTERADCETFFGDLAGLSL